MLFKSYEPSTKYRPAMRELWETEEAAENIKGRSLAHQAPSI